MGHRPNRKSKIRQGAIEMNFKRKGFQPNLLPDPNQFYRQHLNKLKTVSSSQAIACCAFHNDRNPSLSINLETGAFFCFSCGAKSGGVIDFLMQLKGYSFKEAAKEVGAWN